MRCQLAGRCVSEIMVYLSERVENVEGHVAEIVRGTESANAVLGSLLRSKTKDQRSSSTNLALEMDGHALGELSKGAGKRHRELRGNL
uniref:Uncharacterized protein n=1 Tax=Pristionchus pacificus TaxID=54126 RepID=A0A2A6C0J8_PRIPA|eukprot:PDM71626.1 hypothetical protein PRIPAC_38033 [Pristionchus pacificus]